MSTTIKTPAGELPADVLALVEARLQNERKSLVLAYVFWLCIGYLGAHHFYLGRKRTGILYTVCVIVMTFGVLASGATSALGVDAADFWSVIAGVAILIVSFGMVIDLFLMPRYTREAIAKRRDELIAGYLKNGYL